LSLRSRRAGCGGMNPEPMSNSRRQARNCSLEDKRPPGTQTGQPGAANLVGGFLPAGLEGA
jgi:hypothetical protein